MGKVYKEPIESELETTVNVLYGENCISVYTNKANLQRQLRKVLGKPEKEYVKGKSVLASRWNVPLNEKTKISKMMLRANIFDL